MQNCALNIMHPPLFNALFTVFEKEDNFIDFVRAA